MQQVLSHVLFAHLIGGFLAEVRQLPHRPQVSVNGPFGLPCQPQVIDHFPEEISFEKPGLSG
jgi:hypothetical protein